jgi:hypothetical protein
MMNYDDVQPGMRIICHSRGEIPGTVVSKSERGPKPIVLIDYGKGRTGYNWLDQISPLESGA